MIKHSAAQNVIKMLIDRKNFLSQNKWPYDFSPVCVLKGVLRCPYSENILSHQGQQNDLFTITIAILYTFLVFVSIWLLTQSSKPSKIDEMLFGSRTHSRFFFVHFRQKIIGNIFLKNCTYFIFTKCCCTYKLLFVHTAQIFIKKRTPAASVPATRAVRLITGK